MRAEERTRELAECFRDFCARGCLALRFCRGAGLARGDALSVAAFGLRFMPVLAACRGVLPSAHACCLCVPAGIVCSFDLSGRWAGARRCAFCRRVLPSVYACPCGSVGAFCRRLTPAVCAFLPVLCVRLPCRDAGLVRGDALSVAAHGLRFESELAVLSRCLPSVHACLFSFVRKKETACGMLRFYSAGSRSPLVRSRGALRLSAFVGSLRVCAFLYGDLDGLSENGERRNGAGGAALVRFCASALAL